MNQTENDELRRLLKAKLAALVEACEMAPAPVPDDPRWGLVAQLADVVASIWGRSDCIEGEAKAIAAKLRGGARWITLEQLRKELAPVPDDTRELVAQLADLVAWAMPTMNHHKGVKAIAAKLRGGA